MTTVVREPRTSRERLRSTDVRACLDPDTVPPVQAASSRRTAEWVRGLDRLARRRPDAVGTSPLARVALDALRASV